MIDLSGRYVLVTGGSRGIGAATARLLAAAGATVLVHYRHAADRAESVLEDLRLLCDADHRLHAADLSRPEEVESLFTQVEDAWGRLDCLVNNAGIWVRNPLAGFDPGRYQETWEVNERAPFLCASFALPLLRQAEDGNIVNLSSTAGQRGEAFYSPYAASKGAMIAATLATTALVLYLGRVAKRTGSGAVRADALHYRTDIGANLAVLAGVGLAYVTGIQRIDGLLSIGVAAYVLLSAGGLLRTGMRDLLDTAAPEERRGSTA